MKWSCINKFCLRDDQFTFFLGKDCLEVERSNVEDLLGLFSLGDVGLGETELDFSGSGLKVCWLFTTWRRYTLMPSSQSWYTLKTGSMGVSSAVPPFRLNSPFESVYPWSNRSSGSGPESSSQSFTRTLAAGFSPQRSLPLKRTIV